MALFNDNTEYKNDNTFLIMSDAYDDLLESYDYNINVIKAIHNHDINDITLTESYNKQEILRECIGDIFKTIKDKIIQLWNIVKNFFKRIFGINKDIAETNKEVAKKTEEAIRNNNISEDTLDEDEDTLDEDTLDEKDIHHDKVVNNIRAEYKVNEYLVFSEPHIKNIFETLMESAYSRLGDFSIDNIISLKDKDEKDIKTILGNIRSNILHKTLDNKESDNKESDNKTVNKSMFIITLNGYLTGKETKYNFNDIDNMQLIIDRLKNSGECIKLFKKLESETDDIFKTAIDIMETIKNDISSSYDEDKRNDIILGCKNYISYLTGVCGIVTDISNVYNDIFKHASGRYKVICEKYHRRIL